MHKEQKTLVGGGVGGKSREWNIETHVLIGITNIIIFKKIDDYAHIG